MIHFEGDVENGDYEYCYFNDDDCIDVMDKFEKEDMKYYEEDI